MALDLYQPLILLQYIHTAIFRIQYSEIGVLASVIPNLTNVSILEISTAPDFKKINVPTTRLDEDGLRQVRYNSTQLVNAIKTLKHICRLSFNDCSLNAIVLSALDASWIPYSLIELECVAGHFIDTDVRMNRNHYNHIKKLSFGFGPQSLGFVAFPFCQLTSLEISDDWDRVAYQGDMIQEALNLNKHTLKTVICFALDSHELMFLVQNLRNLEVLKVFRFRESLNAPKYNLSTLFNELIICNGDVSNSSRRSLSRIGSDSGRSSYYPQFQGQYDFSSSSSSSSSSSNRHYRHNTHFQPSPLSLSIPPQDLPKGKLRLVTLPVQIRLISYPVLEHFICHFRNMTSLVFYHYYPLLAYTEPDTNMFSTIRSKIEDLLAIPPGLRNSSSSSSSISNITTTPTNYDTFPMTAEQFERARDLVGKSCCNCSGSYGEINKFDDKAVHFFFNLNIIRDNAFMIRRYQDYYNNNDNN